MKLIADDLVLGSNQGLEVYNIQSKERTPCVDGEYVTCIQVLDNKVLNIIISWSHSIQNKDFFSADSVWKF